MIEVKIPPDIFAAANNFAFEIVEGDTKAWFDVRDAIAKAILAERNRCAEIAYRVCAEKRHVTLGDKVSAAIIGTS